MVGLFMKFSLHTLALFLCFSSVSVNAVESLECPPPKPGGLHQGFGPYDYRDPANRHNLSLVEAGHFTPKVVILKAGQSGYLDQDIDYTLRAFPNHPRALQALANLALREKKAALANMHFTVPCFYIRASKFAPNDGIVDAIYAYYLANLGQKEMAMSAIQEALRKEPNNPKVVYEVGLAYFHAGDRNMAKQYSNKAKSLGSTAVGLDKLLSSSPAPKEASKPEPPHNKQINAPARAPNP
jgi:tetratricopeptide (TPR) repeat protein